MARKAPTIMLTDFEVKILQSVKMHCPDKQLSKRCAAILECMAGRPNKEAAIDTGLDENTVGYIRRAAAVHDIDSLVTTNLGTPGIMSDSEIASRIVDLIADSSVNWTAVKLAGEISAPVKRVRSVLRDMDIPLQRQRIWTIQSSEAVLSDHPIFPGVFVATPGIRNHYRCRKTLFYPALQGIS